MEDPAEDQVELKKKYIIFRNPYTSEVISKTEVPRFIKLTNTEICDLQCIRSRLKMLYIDILCRGYHPVKGFEIDARNVFKHQEYAEGAQDDMLNLITISNNEAMGTIWRCLAREIGRPVKNYNMRLVEAQLTKQLKLMRESVSLTDSEKLFRNRIRSKPTYESKLAQLSSIEKRIKDEMQAIAARCKAEEQKSREAKKHVAAVMGRQIVELEHRIFVQTVIGIRQLQENTELVQFVMEQAYPYIHMSKQKAISMLGQELFTQKWQNYQSLKSKYELNNEILHVCHRCLAPLNEFDRTAECNDEHASLNVGHTLLTDPYMYCRQVINENCWEKDCRKFIHPYLIYYALADSEKTAVCNRHYCNKCEGVESSLSTEGYCSYCEGVCDCSRCQGMDLLTKMMAVFIDNGGDLVAIQQQFWLKFDSKILETRNKKNIKARGEREKQFRDLLSHFYESKIMIRKKQINNFEKQLYFSERIEKDSLQRLEKYKARRINIDISNTDKLERKQKEYQELQRIKRINDKLKKSVGNSDGSDQDAENTSQARDDRKSAPKLSMSKKTSTVEKADGASTPVKQKTFNDLYYSDSD